MRLKQHIINLIPEKSHVLDLGCGNGELLKTLMDQKNVDGYGIEIDRDNVIACIKDGISVYHGDLAEALSRFPDQSFDIVVLSQTLQQVKDPLEVVSEMLRVGKKAIVTFPNFAHWKNRVALFFGFVPKNRALPYRWFDTPNIRVVSIKSFQQVCVEKDIKILHEVRHVPSFLSNLFTEIGMFVIQKSEKKRV